MLSTREVESIERDYVRGVSVGGVIVLAGEVLLADPRLYIEPARRDGLSGRDGLQAEE